MQNSRYIFVENKIIYFVNVSLIDICTEVTLALTAAFCIPSVHIEHYLLCLHLYALGGGTCRQPGGIPSNLDTGKTASSML